MLISSKRLCRWLALLASLHLAMLAGCAASHDGGLAYQNSTIESLLDGNYDGDIAC